ncbi:hypothetical protein E2R51_16560 [Jeotgalibacillus sp. S-D1]|uniref:phosphotransferase enzyme family protein n=1 Tax=Jeotgalibacillus sp. S-D1 TaxID=2552189 RepID=UPI0010597C24|nr:phosphotransferase [Jeotgalibacillus sp. S-D1]TDL30934.1 hypothetical protein E2R51_16560 [Jeotgalibacillus sp. S-D1]
MEQWVEKLFSKEVLAKAADRYGANAANAKKLGDFENYVYEVYKENQPYILRLTHSSHRSKSEVLAELEWINYLYHNGINASLVHRSLNGELVEEMQLGDSSFLVCLFDKAPGNPVKMNDPDFGPDLFEKWGEMTGKMHRVTMNYQEGTAKRAHWTKDDLIDLSPYLDQKKDAIIIEGNDELVKKIGEFPETKEAFGLIHSDIHSGNFFLHNKEVHVFDFDDSMYFYYISDIAIPLYYASWWKHQNSSLEARSVFGKRFLTHFLKGYLKENKIEETWIQRLPDFLKLRDYCLYGVFHKKVDLESGNEREQKLVADIRQRLIRDELVVDFNFGEVLQLAYQMKD